MTRSHYSPLLLLVGWFFANTLAGETYYLDSVAGDDSHTGHTPGQAWGSLAKVNSTVFQPGDRILFRSGCTWRGQLRPRGSGAPGRPIEINRYGEGPLPVISAEGALGAVFELVDQDWWEIRHLDLRGGGARAGPGERGGIWVEGRQADRVLEHIHITNCRISDIRGDFNYRSCGIWVAVPSWGDERHAPNGLSVADVLVAGNEIRDVSRAGIIVMVHGARPYWMIQPAQKTGVQVQSFRYLEDRTCQLTYAWQIGDSFNRDLTCFVQLSNEKGKTFSKQAHQLPVPTSQWRQGITLTDGPHTLEIPEAFTGSVITIDAVLGGRFRMGTDRVQLAGVPGTEPLSTRLGRITVQRTADRITGMMFSRPQETEKQTDVETTIEMDTPHWGGRSPGRDIVVRDNTLTDLAGDAIIVFGAQEPLIEHNTARRSCLDTGAPKYRPHQGYNQHSAAIWLQHCIAGVIQFNEVSHTGRQLDNNDGMAFDFDYNCFSCVVQYNVSRENEGGLLLIMPTARNNVVRYNLSLNDRTRVLFMQSRYDENNLIHNNVFAVDTPVYFTPGGRLWNNIFYATGHGAFFWTTEPEPDQFRNNCYFGRWESVSPWRNRRPPDPGMIEADPLFVAPGTGGEGIDAWTAYQLQPESPCRDAGVPIPDNGDRDFWGQRLTDGKPDIGAFELPPAQE